MSFDILLRLIQKTNCNQRLAPVGAVCKLNVNTNFSRETIVGAILVFIIDFLTMASNHAMFWHEFKRLNLDAFVLFSTFFFLERAK